MDTTGTPLIGQFESLAHGWAAGPTVTLTNQVLGVTPTSAGYDTCSVIPHPASLSWAQGSAPTRTARCRQAGTHRRTRSG